MIQVLPTLTSEEQQILSKECLQFIEKLHTVFNPTRLELLKARAKRFEIQEQLEFPKETEEIRNGNWSCCKPAPGLVDRRVEITGPVDRKMVINALNSGATQYMADFEDATSPFFKTIVQGHLNLTDAVHKRIDFVASNGKQYKLNLDIATLLVRPRGWHMLEYHVLVNNEPISASIFDFGVYFFHNAQQLIKNGYGPYFYLPKLEHYLEARLWNSIFNSAQDSLKIPRSTIRATVLIETIMAATQMDEILYELRDHSSGLNCGRWDYIFSCIKYFRQSKKSVLPDRKCVGMDAPFMQAYTQLLIKTCHRRGVHAMGGMAAHIPVKDNESLNQQNMEKVRKDKLREVKAGHDGSWVAHPALVPVALAVFNEHMPLPNQLHELKTTLTTCNDLLNFKVNGSITEEGVKENVFVSLSYLSAWLLGKGAVPIMNLMEDAATVEISRSQLWSWVKHKCTTEDNQLITEDYVLNWIEKVSSEMPSTPTLIKAKGCLKAMITGKETRVKVENMDRVKDMVGYPLFVTDVLGLEIVDSVVLRYSSKL